METIRIIEKLSKRHPNVTYAVTQKKRVELVVVITTAVSFLPSVTMTLDHVGSEGVIRCLVMPKRGTNVSVRIYVKHRKPKTKSAMTVQAILQDSCSVVFDDYVRIEKTAVLSEATQTMHTLFIGAYGTASMRPVLEILNNDVVCTHGATSGEIPSDELWYAASRGISQSTAKKLYVEGCIRDTIGDIRKQRMKVRL